MSTRQRGEEAENHKQQNFHETICFSLNNLHPVYKLKKNQPGNKKRIIWVMGRIRFPRKYDNLFFIPQHVLS